MAEGNTVVRTIEDIDLRFSQIEINGQTYDSDRYVPPEPSAVVTPEPETEQTQEENEQQTTPARETQGQDVYAVVLNDILHDFVDQAVTQGLQEEIAERRQEDTTLSNAILAETLARQRDITNIESLIPEEASDENQLADKAFVTDIIDDLNVAEVGGNGKYIKSIKQEDGKIVAEADWLSATGGGVAFIGTRAEYEVAKLIPLGQTGHIPSGALVIITDEDSYIEGENR